MDGPGVASALTSALAQEIAGSTTDIIGFNVLITDRSGTVIGSGDRTRVGTFHEASVEVVRTLRSATHSAAQARGLRGVRPGITLPIVLGDAAMGTVGITGSPGQVRRFGLVVKRQTEILLQESLLLRSRMLRERALEDVVRDVAYFDADVVEPDLIAYRAGELGYDLTAPRVAIVVDLVGSAGPDESTSRPALLQTLRASFTGAQDIVAAMSSVRFVALHRLPPTHADDGRGFSGRALDGRALDGRALDGHALEGRGLDSRALDGRGFDGHVDELQRLCRKTIDEIGRRHGLTAAVGIGDRATTVVELHESYRDASVALRLGARLATRTTNEPRISSIDDLRIHQLLAAVGHRPRARLIEALTADLRAQPDWPALRQTLLAWCESGFNLVHAANALHIHRNTLVYRLNKIAQRTGRPARDHRATLALYLACLADQIHDPGQP